MKTLYRLFGIFSVSGLLLLPLAGCEQDMGEPEPGEAVEEAGEGIGEGIEETGEGVGEGVEDVTDGEEY